MNGKIDQEERADDDVQDKDLLESLFQNDAGWTQDLGAVNFGVANVRGDLKADLKRAQLRVPTTANWCRTSVVRYWRLVMMFGDV